MGTQPSLQTHGHARDRPAILEAAPYLLVDESEQFTHIARLSFPGDQEFTVSLVVVPWVDYGATRQMFGRQWPVRADVRDCTIQISSSNSRLLASFGEVAPMVSWNSANLREEDVYAATLSIHTPEENLQEQRRLELVYLTQGTLKVFERCLSGRYVSDYLQGLAACSRFEAFLTNFCSVSLAGKKVLVSGCGTGGECAIAQDLGAREVVGIDTSADAISAGLARFSKRDGFRLYPYDGNRIPEPDSCYDVVISRHVLEHVPLETRWHYCVELFRVLKQGGIAIFEFPNQRCPVEAHTDIEFFHLLPHSVKWEILDYYEKCEAAGWPRHPVLDKYLALSGRINVSREEFLYYLKHLAFRTNVKNEFRLHPTLGVIDHDCCPEFRFEVEKLQV